MPNITKPGELAHRTDNFAILRAEYSWIDQARERDKALAKLWRPWWHLLIGQRGG
jgi:hypothetical protein